jgi:hypothetical protein
MLGTILVVIFMVLEILIFPFADYKKKLSLSLSKKEKDLIELVELCSEYHKLKSEADTVQKMSAKRDSNFSVFTFLETISRNTNIKENVKYMKPSDVKTSGSIKESMVEMEIDNINLQQLMKFLYEVEFSDVNATVKRISIKKKQNQKGMLDVILQVVTYETVS